MSVKNLHSLINGRWFIHESYGHSLLPSLFSILEGKAIFPDASKKEPEVFISIKSNKAGLVSAAEYNSGGDSSSQFVAVVNLKDPIYKYNQECGPSGTKTKMAIMSRFEKDPNCAGIVLDIDSGGGQVSGTPEFYDFIKNFSKPVVAYTDGYMCSAAYYIGSAASHIVANQRAEHIGSIGVMIHFVDFSGMYEKKGAKIITEYSTHSPEKNRSFEELLKGNSELYIKKELDPIAEDFIKDIKAVRKNVAEEVFKGGTWNATDALTKNLVDEIGSLQTAINKAFELSKSSNSNNNINSKTKTMSKKTKSFPAIQKVLGLKDEGIATISTVLGNKGVQLTEAQLETLNNALVEKETAVTTANGKVTEAEGKVTTLGTAVDAALTVGKLTAEASATTEEKITLLGAKVLEYGNKPGAKTAKPKSEGDSFEENDALVNEADAHNELYNKL